MRWLLAVPLLAALPLVGGTAADVSQQIRENTFDRDECYRVRDLTIFKEDIRLYLNDGFLIFSKPVAGRRIAAVFVADNEGGDGEVILLPPVRGERRSLAAYINSPNLDEHFHAALFFSTSDLYSALVAQMPNNPANRKAPEMGALLDENWTPALRNLSASYQTRIALDLLAEPVHKPDLLVSILRGATLGSFDLIYDPMAPEQIVAGQLSERNDRSFFDVWTSFTARSFRDGAWKSGFETRLDDYRIEATVEADLTLDAVTRVKVTPLSDMRVVPFDIAQAMDVSAATVDGSPAEVLQREALRTNVTRGANQLFLVLPAGTLRAGRTYEFEFHHRGKVIRDAGDHVFYVTARGDWYPGNGVQFAYFDLQFRYERDLDLITPGDVVDDRTEGEWRTTRRRTKAPIRWAGFNLGRYAHARVARGGYTVDVYANKALETALQPKMPDPVMVMPPIRTTRGPTVLQSVPMPQTEALASSGDKLQGLASEIASALEFMVGKFGAPALSTLAVSPIPDTFGQGFPGLIYLSTLSYVKPPNGGRSREQDTFYSDILQAHETAHQWWGNLVTATGYHDNWLMEALAHYSALLYVEKRRGTPWMEQTLAGFRDALLVKTGDDSTIDATGPIVLGSRLENSQEPRAWRAITYGKGAWIIHMLRRRVGDERFFAMLADLRRDYARKEITTEGFRLFAAKYLPPKSGDPKLEGFFDQWVYNTGIPTLKMSYSVKGKLPNLRLVGTLTQTGVGEDFGAPVPIEIQTARGKSVIEWVTSANEPVSFSFALKQQPLKVLLDPHNSVLRK